MHFNLDLTLSKYNNYRNEKEVSKYELEKSYIIYLFIDSISF